MKSARQDAISTKALTGVVVYSPDIGIENRTGTIVLPDEQLLGGWAEVYVDGYDKPVKASVSLDEYIGKKRTVLSTRSGRQNRLL